MGLLISSIPDRACGMRVEWRKHPSSVTEISIPRGSCIIVQSTAIAILIGIIPFSSCLPILNSLQAGNNEL
jgi:hypothetical protein